MATFEETWETHLLPGSSKLIPRKGGYRQVSCYRFPMSFSNKTEALQFIREAMAAGYVETFSPALVEEGMVMVTYFFIEKDSNGPLE